MDERPIEIASSKVITSFLHVHASQISDNFGRNACPKCEGSFLLDVFEEMAGGNGDVDEGLLRCTCGAWYPIVGGIPVILPNAS